MQLSVFVHILHFVCESTRLQYVNL